jgi:hypothetical protein
MTAQLELERILDEFIGEGTNELSDHVLEAALRDTEHIQQRRAWRVPRRYSDMPTPLRLLAAAAIIATAMGGAFLLGGSFRNDATPNPLPTPTPVGPSPSMSAAPPAVLPAGPHTTTTFEPAVTFTVPRGWVLNREEPDFFELCPASLDDCNGAQVHVYRFPSGEKPLAVDNKNRVVPGVGSDLLDVMTHIAERTDVTLIQPPTEWEVDGLSGYWMEVANPGTSELVLIKDGQNLYPTGRNRFAHIEMPDGTVVSIVIFTFEGTEAFLDLATPIIESFDFE